MAVMYKLTFAVGTAPLLDPKRSLMTVVDAPAAATTPATNEVILYLGDTVAKRRRLEIINTWKWVFAGIKERNLIDKTPWNAQAIVSVVNIDKRNLTDRRTAATIGAVTFDETTDVGIGWGASVAPVGMTADLRSAVYKLIRFANENKATPI